jgi:HK97 family phage major capsid protein
MTSVPAWAGVLVRDSYAAFMDLLRPESVVPRLPLSTHEFNGYNTIKIPARTANTPNLAGAFRAEGAPIRVGALALTSITLTPKSLGVIGSFTAEMLERSTPSIEAIIRDAMVQDTAAALDIAFLSNIAGTAIQPAGIQTYATGGNTAASAGTTSANLIADVRGRMQAMTAAGMGRRPVWVMNPARWFGAQLSVTAAGTPTFPEAASGTILGLPVVTSTSVPPAVVFLIDAAEVSFAGGAPRFLGTDVATLHEEDTAPLPIADAGATAGGSATGVGNGPVRSLFQTNSAALRAVWEVDWAVMRPNGAVQTITAAAW